MEAGFVTALNQIRRKLIDSILLGGACMTYPVYKVIARFVSLSNLL